MRGKHFMSKITFGALFVISLVALPLIYQNCAGIEALRDEKSSLKDASVKLRQQHCVSCHGGGANHPEPRNILDDEALLSGRWIIPGKPADSPVYVSLSNGMPPAGPLSESEKDVIRLWIERLDLAPAKLTFSTSDDYNFGSVQKDSALTHVFTIQNTGGDVARGLLRTGLEAPFSIDATETTCGSELPAGNSCNVAVKFSPTAEGSFSDTLEIAYLNGRDEELKSATKNVSGTGTLIATANLRFAAGASGAFGVVAVGGQKDITLTVENIGSGAASTIAVGSLAAPFSQNGGSCQTQLNPSNTCTIIVRFAPSTAASHTGALGLTYFDGAQNQTLSPTSLSGIGAGGSGTDIYFQEIRSILTAASCDACHTGASGNWGTIYDALIAFKHPSTQMGPAIVPSNTDSRFIKSITEGYVIGGNRVYMGGGGAYGTLTAEQKQKIFNWIANGAPNIAPNPATLTISDAPTYNFGNVVIGQEAQHAFNIKNTGGTAATNLAGVAFASSSPFNYVKNSYPGAGSGTLCGTTLAPGASCLVYVKFVPPSAGAHNANLSLTYMNGASSSSQTVSRALTGTGQTPASAVLMFASGTSGAFGISPIGKTVSKTVTIENKGSATANNLAPAALAAPFALPTQDQANACKTSLAAGQTCTVKLNFSPTAVGDFMKVFTVSYNSNSSITLTLTGTGTNGASTLRYSAIRDILNAEANGCKGCHMSGMGNWGSTYAALMAFKWPATFTTPAIQASSPSSRFIAAITTGTSAGHIMGAPAGGATPYGVLTASDRQKIIDWIVSGALDDLPAAPAQLTISDSPSYSYGNVTVGQSKDKTFVITNTGQKSATEMTLGAFAGGFSKVTTGTNCTTSLAAGATCNLVVKFAPTAVGTVSSNVAFNYHNGSAAGQTVARAISGVGVAAATAVLTFDSSTTLDFGTVFTGDWANKTVTIKNAGSVGAKSIKITAPTPFVRTGGTCTTTLTTGQSCTVTLRYQPTSATFTDKLLTVAYDNGSSSAQITRKMQGTGQNPSATAVNWTQINQVLTSGNCIACHSTGTPNFNSYASVYDYIKADNGARFKAAITTGTPQGHIMGKGNYGLLTSANVATILSWIDKGAPNASFPLYAKTMTGDRYYISSVLTKIFLGTAVEPTKNRILTRWDMFAAPCHYNDLEIMNQDSNARAKNVPAANDYCKTSISSSEADMLPTTTPVSESIRVMTCMRIVNALTDGNMNTQVLAPVGLALTSEFTAANVSALYSRFYTGSVPTEVQAAALATIGEEAKLKLAGTMDQRKALGWRAIALTLCMSPGWQAP